MVPEDFVESRACWARAGLVAEEGRHRDSCRFISICNAGCGAGWLHGCFLFTSPPRNNPCPGSVAPMDMICTEMRSFSYGFSICNYNYYSVKDLVGYEIFIDPMPEWGIDRLPGDFLEIGAFIGGGTAKLARAAEKWGKLVYAVDIFEPSTDLTANQAGFTMAGIYAGILSGRDQEELFYRNTQGLDNIRMLKIDSRELRFPEEQKFAFVFIDGNHDPDVVWNDIRLAWPALVSGGILGFHDYEGDLPQTTKAINEFLEAYDHEIARLERLPRRWVLLVFKK